MRSYAIRKYDVFADVRDEWERLEEKNAGGRPLLSYDLIAKWYECFSGRDAP